MNAQGGTGGGIARSTPGGGTLADVLDRVLDKGIMIDAWASVSLVGLEIIGVQAKVVVASVETYLKYASAIASVGTQPPEKASTAKPKALVEKPTPQAALPSEAEVAKYLAEHSSGLRLEQLVEHFHAPRKELEEAIGHLLGAQKARMDEARKVILPAPTKS